MAVSFLVLLQGTPASAATSTLYATADCSGPIVTQKTDPTQMECRQGIPSAQVPSMGQMCSGPKLRQNYYDCNSAIPTTACEVGLDVAHREQSSIDLLGVEHVGLVRVVVGLRDGLRPGLEGRGRGEAGEARGVDADLRCGIGVDPTLRIDRGAGSAQSLQVRHVPRRPLGRSEALGLVLASGLRSGLLVAPKQAIVLLESSVLVSTRDQPFGRG